MALKLRTKTQITDYMD